MANTFTFPLDTASKAGAVRPIRFNGVDYTDFVLPISHLGGEAVLLTSTALGVSAAYTQASQDRYIAKVVVAYVRGAAAADQAGTLYIEESQDGTTWTTTTTVSVTANTLADSGWVTLSQRYYRFRYVNGATAQTSFSLWQSIAATAEAVTIYGPTGQPLLTTSNPGAVQGVAAHGAAAAGNPLRLAAVYRAVAPNVADGSVVDLFADAAGRIYVRSADGHIESLGTTSDLEATGNGTLIAIAKRLRSLLAGGLPAALTVGGNLKVALLEALPAGANLVGKVQLRNPSNTADLGDATNPVRVDPTGTTTQPVSLSTMPTPTTQIPIWNGLAILDTGLKDSGFINIAAYKRKTITIQHSLNQPITTVGILVRNRDSVSIGYVYYRDTLSIGSSPGAVISSGADTGSGSVTKIVVPHLDLPWWELRLQIACSTAPTSGAVYVYMMAEKY